jgi:hypothetical protein
MFSVAVRSGENGTPAWYLLGKDEGHGFRKRRNADYQFYLTVLFLKRYLLTESTLAAGRGQ